MKQSSLSGSFSSGSKRVGPRFLEAVVGGVTNAPTALCLHVDRVLRVDDAAGNYGPQSRDGRLVAATAVHGYSCLKLPREAADRDGATLLAAAPD